MTTDTIVPFVNAAAKRANDVLIERMKGVAANDDPGAAQGGDPNMDVIKTLLEALEGMQTQVQALTELVITQDKRIAMLEGKGKSKIISVRN